MKKVIVLAFTLLAMQMSFAQTQLELNKRAQFNFLKADNELNNAFKKILTEYKEDTLFIKNLDSIQRCRVENEISKY